MLGGGGERVFEVSSDRVGGTGGLGAGQDGRFGGKIHERYESIAKVEGRAEEQGIHRWRQEEVTMISSHSF